jgi:hypothetical protein
MSFWRRDKILQKLVEVFPRFLESKSYKGISTGESYSAQNVVTHRPP